MRNCKEMIDYSVVNDYIHDLKTDNSLSQEEYEIVKLIEHAIELLPRQTVALDSHWDWVINEERIGWEYGKSIPLYYNGYKCSNCGHGGGDLWHNRAATIGPVKELFGNKNYRYCPNCGARMINGQDKPILMLKEEEANERKNETC